MRDILFHVITWGARALFRAMSGDFNLQQCFMQFRVCTVNCNPWLATWVGEDINLRCYATFGDIKVPQPFIQVADVGSREVPFADIITHGLPYVTPVFDRQFKCRTGHVGSNGKT